MNKILSRSLATLLLGAQLATAAPDQATTNACNEIKDALPGKVLTPGLLAFEYKYETTQYWSTNLREVDPACIVQPASAEDVSTVVKVLIKYPSVKFATRSGGHDPNPGHATVQDGVLIAMTDMAGATYDADKKVAYVKPGGEWNDVIGDLEKYGVTITGGRLGQCFLNSLTLFQLTSICRSCRRWWISLAGWYLIPQCSRRSRRRCQWILRLYATCLANL